LSSLLYSIIRRGLATQRELFPDLPDYAEGLPTVTAEPCQGAACVRCATLCPSRAISVAAEGVTLDRGLCLGCNTCVRACPTGTLASDRGVKTAVRTRQELVLSRDRSTAPAEPAVRSPFRRSLHIREVATGDSATDMEIISSTNAVFDISRFGVHFTASPRFADMLLVSGPVPLAMRDPLRRCYDSMAEPRLVVAVGASAISGGLFSGSYTEANGVDSVLPVAAYIPGDPPHPWSIIHGVLLAIGRI
jgi:Ni,Fe-hydrogenase III small subunit/ferredoxin